MPLKVIINSYFSPAIAKNRENNKHGSGKFTGYTWVFATTPAQTDKQ